MLETAPFRRKQPPAQPSHISPFARCGHGTREERSLIMSFNSVVMSCQFDPQIRPGRTGALFNFCIAVSQFTFDRGRTAYKSTVIPNIDPFEGGYDVHRLRCPGCIARGSPDSPAPAQTAPSGGTEMATGDVWISRGERIYVP